jgi:Domain of unknown function (DUF1707)
MAQDPRAAANLRIGDRERDAVATVLREAAVAGRLSMEELDDRLEAALQAKTYADLDPLVADLSVELPSSALTSSRRPQGPPSPGYSREDPLRLEGGASSEKRRGVWTVPPFLVINQQLGAVKLNFLEAVPDAQLIDIRVVGGAGSILLVVPDGWGVDADRVSKGLGSKSVKVSREPAPGKPLLVLYGSVGVGSLKVRPPNRLEQRRVTVKPDRRQLGR